MSFKTTWCEAVFIRTLLDLASPDWLTDCSWEALLGCCTALCGLPIYWSALSLFSAFLSLSFSCPLLFCLVRLTPGAPLTHGGWELSQSDAMMLNSSPMNTIHQSSVRLSVSGSWLEVHLKQVHWTYSLSKESNYLIACSLTWLLYLKTETPIIR